MEMTIIGILVFLIICATICLFIGYYRYTKLAHKLAMNRNNVHFYVARDEYNNTLYLYLGKPYRYISKFISSPKGCIIETEDFFYKKGLNTADFSDLKWEDEPVEVFLNLE